MSSSSKDVSQSPILPNLPSLETQSDRSALPSQTTTSIKSVAQNIFSTDQSEVICPIMMSDPKNLPEIGKIQELSTEILSSENKAKLMTHVKSEAREIFEGMLTKIDDYIVQSKQFGSIKELKLKNNEYEFKIQHESENPSSIKILFHQTIAKSIGKGAFKKTNLVYEFKDGNLNPLLGSKEVQVTPSNVINARREQNTFRTCKENNIRGTAEAHAISYRVGTTTDENGEKIEVVKHAVMQKFYPQGTLEKNMLSSPPLSNEQKMNIATKLLDTLKQYHQAGMSHNDIKPDNIVLDENLDPILIDFGSTTTIEDPDVYVITPIYASPEMFVEGFDSVTSQEMMLYYQVLQKKLEEEYDILDQQHDLFLEDMVNNAEKLFKVEDRMEEINSSIDQINKQIEDEYDEQISNIRLSQTVPHANDYYALGMVLDELFEENAPESITSLIHILKTRDPHERISLVQNFKF